MVDAVKISHLTKKFGQDIIFDDISLCVPTGEIVGLVGPNGSGKSILFKIISGLVKVSEGEVYVWGSEIGKKGCFPTNAGFLIERPGFLPHLSGYINLEILAAIQNKIDKPQIRHTMEQVGLDADLKRSYAKYSLGMKQKLGIAQALMEKPKLLVLDEPMNNLDEKSVQQMRDLFLALNQDQNVTIIMSSHDINDIKTLCRYVYKIEGNKIVPHI